MVQTIKRVAIYCRVSTDDQDCERQEHDLKAFAARAGFKVTGLYKDVASGAKNDRKARQQVMELARGRHFDAILVTELTRWGRSTTDLLATLQELASYGASVIAEHGWQFDMTTPEGRLMVTVMAGIAEFERGLMQQRVKSGMALAKAAGKHCGRKPIDVDPVEIERLAGEGKSIRAIASEVGVSPMTVQRTLKAIS